MYVAIKSQKAAQAALLATKDPQATDDSKTGEQPLPPPITNGVAMETGGQVSEHIKQEPPEHNGISSELVSCECHVTGCIMLMFMYSYHGYQDSEYCE